MNAPQENVNLIVAKGGIPVVRVQRLPLGAAELIVEELESSTKYIAISHVWADGLGNPRGNALPQCQLQRIQDFVDKCPMPSNDFNVWPHTRPTIKYLDPGSFFRTSKPTLFWIDTLCVPVAPEDDRLRKLAIARMAAIYAGASQVLVLDRHLMTLKINQSELTKVLTNLLVSGWMPRCWTFEEGSLSRCFKLQLSDGAFNPMEEWTAPWDFTKKPFSILEVIAECLKWKRFSSSSTDARKGLIWMVVQCLRRDLIRQINWSNPGAGNVHSDTRFANVWRSLAHRSTSKMEDATIILATLAGFNTSKMLMLDSEADKMTSVLASLGRLPVSILFNTGPRFNSTKAHRDRWLPTYPSDGCIMRGDDPSLLSVHDGDLEIRTHRRRLRSCTLLSVTGDIGEYGTTVTFGHTTLSIRLHRDPSDEFVRELGKQLVILIESPVIPGSAVSGAILQVDRYWTETSTEPMSLCEFLRRTRTNERRHAIHVFDAVYHCPMEADIHTSSSQDLSAIRAKRIRHWRLHVMSGKETLSRCQNSAVIS